MRFETYELKTRDSMLTFEFISEGPKGSIKKRVQYFEIDDNLYNLAFGDVNEETGDFDDNVISHNKDTEKVLATVAETVYAFAFNYPKAYIHLKGSTNTRTRLYRMAISNNLEEINEKFYVLGLLNDSNWVIFEKNNNYSAFIIKSKNE